MDKQKFYAALRKRNSGVFGSSLSQGQVTGMEGILQACHEKGVVYNRHVAYVLATAYRETGRRMMPVREGFAKSDAAARRAVQRLAKKRGPNSAVARYVLPLPPYGHVYYGRGHPQLTWAENYKAMSAVAGVDLFRDPDKMLDPVISARVLVYGMMSGKWNGKGKGLAYYINEEKTDLKNARRTVNITDKWDLIAEYYQSFLAALEESTMNGRIGLVMPKAAPPVVKPVEEPKVETAPKDHVPVHKEKESLGSLLVQFIAALFGRK